MCTHHFCRSRDRSLDMLALILFLVSGLPVLYNTGANYNSSLLLVSPFNASLHLLWPALALKTKNKNIMVTPSDSSSRGGVGPELNYSHVNVF